MRTGKGRGKSPAFFFRCARVQLVCCFNCTLAVMFTHTGRLVGCDSRTSPNYSRLVELRGTKKYWITKHGDKYRKDTGWGVGDWPLLKLDLETLAEVAR